MIQLTVFDQTCYGTMTLIIVGFVLSAACSHFLVTMRVVSLWDRNPVSSVCSAPSPTLNRRF
jgi:hypothetical protein